MAGKKEKTQNTLRMSDFQALKTVSAFAEPENRRFKPVNAPNIEALFSGTSRSAHVRDGCDPDDNFLSANGLYVTKRCW